MLPRWLKDLRFWLFYAFVTRRHPGLTTLGEGCTWTVLARELGPRSRVLCGGAGNDISFEEELISKFHCELVLADPSPTGVATVARSVATELGHRFIPVALADYDGQMSFSPPSNPEEGSFRGACVSAADAILFPCKSVTR